MKPAQTYTVSVTMFRETREMEFEDWTGKGDRLESVEQVVVGKFPTGAKLHRSRLTLWRRAQSWKPERPLRGETAAVVNGEEYIADYTVYTHNTNNCRVIGWNDDAFPPELVAQWRSY